MGIKVQLIMSNGLMGKPVNKYCYGFMKNEQIKNARNLEPDSGQTPGWFDGSVEDWRINQAINLYKTFGINWYECKGATVDHILTVDAFSESQSRTVRRVQDHFPHLFPRRLVAIHPTSFKVQGNCNVNVMYCMLRLVRNAKYLPDELSEWLSRFPRWGVVVLSSYHHGYPRTGDEAVLKTSHISQYLDSLTSEDTTWGVNLNTYTWQRLQNVKAFKFHSMLQPDLPSGTRTRSAESSCMSLRTLVALHEGEDSTCYKHLDRILDPRFTLNREVLENA